MKLFSFLAVLVFVSAVSCERHDFKETRQLQEHHAPAGSHEEPAEHAGAHPEKAEH